MVVSEGARIAGLLYAKERVLAGIGTRVAFADDALNAMVVAAAEEREAVIVSAVETLLRQMIGLRLVVPSSWLPLLEKMRANADVDIRPAHRHAMLALQPRYEDFLVRLGPRTRRNLRYYRRKMEQAGSRFRGTLPFADFAAASRALFPNAAYASSRPNLDRCLAMIEAMSRPLMIGLQNSRGEWVSLAGGWYAGERAILLTQLNDRAYTRESISLVMRSYLIETLISEGIRELVFWEGTSAPLCFYADFPQVLRAYIDAPFVWWRVARALCSAATRLLPARAGTLLKWVVPDREDARRLRGANQLPSSESSDALN